LLREAMDSRTIAGIISRLKRRQPDDMPVNGAVLDDIVTAYAEVSIKKAKQTAIEEKGEAPTVAVSEKSLHRVWEFYMETVRLQQSAKRVKLFIDREADATRGARAVVESERPWCVIPATCHLHLEYIQLQAAVNDVTVDAGLVKTLPEDVTKVSPELLVEFGTTLAACVKKWPPDARATKLLSRRISAYKAGGTAATPKKKMGGAALPAHESGGSDGPSGPVASIVNREVEITEYDCLED
jgi:hypothetical protein